MCLVLSAGALIGDVLQTTMGVKTGALVGAVVGASGVLAGAGVLATQKRQSGTGAVAKLQRAGNKCAAHS